MSRITKDLAGYAGRKPALWPGWLPLAVLPIAPFFYRVNFPRWALMWILALCIGAGCKWLTWWVDGRWMGATTARRCAYLMAWPGMNAREFLDVTPARPRPPQAEWFHAGAKTCLGAILVWAVVRTLPAGHELWAGWVGLVGMVFLLHFGLFHWLALLWQRAGVNARPIMRAPLRAASVSEFWNRRWNVAFNQLVHRFVFRPMARKTNLPAACLAAFLVSGLIHDLVISVPAGGGYGLPTAYFMAQGCAVLFERSRTGRRLGLRAGWRGRAFTVMVAAGPVFWLFHPPFIKNVILPMLTAVGATGPMTMKTIPLTLLLQCAGVLHLGLICAGLMMPRAVHLRSHLAQLPPFIRRLFWVYYAFIGLCLAGFGLMTFVFAGTLAAGGGLARALCAFLALFWTIRLVAAAFVFDVRPYLLNRWWRLGYGATNVVFAFLPVLYAWTAFL